MSNSNNAGSTTLVPFTVNAMYHPVLLVWDYGLVCPACVAMQYSKGQLRVIKEFWLEYSPVTEDFYWKRDKNELKI